MLEFCPPSRQVSVSEALEATPPAVVDVRVPLTPAVAAIQEAIVGVMDICLKVRFMGIYGGRAGG